MVTIKNGKQAVKIAKKIITDWDKEHAIGLYLDSANHLKKSELIGMGGLDVCFADPREVLRPALVCAAVGIVLLHNHPSGNVKPSRSDLKATTRINKACRLMGIVFDDHIIFSRGELFYSMMANNKMKETSRA